MPVLQSLDTADPIRSTPEIPELKHHKGTGQAYILAGGKRTYFGRFSLPETHRKYHAFCAELLASGGVALCKGPGATIEQLCAGYLDHARRTYVRPDGSPSGEARNYESALGLLRSLYGPIPCDEFTPRNLRAVRQGMVDRGWSRRSVNRQVVRVRTVFKWGVSEGLVDPSTLASLQCLAGLRAGQGGVRESEPVRALREHQIEPVIAAAPPIVADMIRVQLLTAMRPGEVCAMRPIDLDTSGELWVYTPERHKNQHRGQGRVVVVGPQAKLVLEPYLPSRPVQMPIFSPIESELQRRGDGSMAGPRSRLREAYDTVSYARAVRRACERAFPVPDDLAHDPAGAKRWRDDHRWTPNQLRHTAATRIRSVAGLEMSRIALGHTTASVTEQFYAEADTDKLREVMRRIG